MGHAAARDRQGRRPAAAAPGDGGAPRLARDAGLVLASALLLYLSFRPADASALAWVALVPWLVVLRRAPRRRALWLSALAGGLFPFFAIAWLRLVTPEGWFAAGFGFAGYHVLCFAWPTRAVSERLRLPLVAVAPVFWVAKDYLYGTLFFFRFPWVYLAHTQHDRLALIQVSELTGAFGVTFAIAAANAALADLVCLRLDGALTARRAAAVAAAPAALLLALLAYGGHRMATLPVRDGPRVAAIQGNIPQDLKELQSYQEKRIADHFRLTEVAYGRGARLIVWPETMLPGILDRDPVMQARLAEVARRHGAYLLLGGFHEQEPGLDHNAAWYVAPDGRIVDRYDKIGLAPFSEGVPFKESWPWLHRQCRNLVPPDFTPLTPGEQVKVFSLDGERFAPFICFEDSFTDLNREAVRLGATFLVYVSNDAWFQDSSELEMARDLAVFRAVELRRGAVRCVNTGISNFFDPLGRVEDLVIEGRRKQVEGVLVRTLRTSDVTTLYARFGDVFAWACLAAGGALLALAALRPARAAENP